MSNENVFEAWFREHSTEDVEAIVPDMAGAARGKVVPAAKFADGRMKMPEGVFAQTISGEYIEDPDNVEDRDMWLVADPNTLRPVPWSADPAAAVFMDCYYRDGSPVAKSPRGVLRNVLSKYEARGWVPVVLAQVRMPPARRPAAISRVTRGKSSVPLT